MQTKHKFVGRQAEALIGEISKLAIACDVDILDPECVVRSVRGDEKVCRKNNPAAFKKLRTLLIMLFDLEGRALDRLGRDDLGSIADELIQNLARLRGVEVPPLFRGAGDTKQ